MFGRGELKVASPKPNWTEPGEQYRQAAFELGLDYARYTKTPGVKSLCEFVKGRASAINKDAAYKVPCSSKHDGPNTNMNRKPLVQGDGNR